MKENPFSQKIILSMYTKKNIVLSILLYNSVAAMQPELLDTAVIAEHAQYISATLTTLNHTNRATSLSNVTARLVEQRNIIVNKDTWHDFIMRLHDMVKIPTDTPPGLTPCEQRIRQEYWGIIVKEVCNINQNENNDQILNRINDTIREIDIALAYLKMWVPNYVIKKDV
jgi:hypothetical protein